MSMIAFKKVGIINDTKYSKATILPQKNDTSGITRKELVSTQLK